MNLFKTTFGLGAAALVLGTAGCTPTRTVTRVPADSVTDIDYHFNDTDAREVWQGMSTDSLFRGWIDRWIMEHNGQRPVIIVGPIKNNTQEYIDQALFTANFEKEMLNSGKVRVVSARDERGELRDERLQGQEWNSAETKKIMKNELGADLLLLGVISQVKQTSPNGRNVVQYYQVKLDLSNIETNEKVWIGTVDVKKVSKDS